MKSFISLLALIILAGCASPQVGIPENHAGPVATLKGHLAGPVEFFAGKEAHCQIQSVDGSEIGANYSLLPGKHTARVSLSNMGEEYAGDVELSIPEPKRYQLKARREGARFVLSLVDIDATKVVATSSAPVNQRMQFIHFIFLP